MEQVRDVVVIVTGIVWSIVWLALLAVVLVVFALERKYLKAARRFLQENVREVLDGLQVQADALQNRTAGLPGRREQASASRAAPAASGLGFSFPFLRRRRPWWHRLLRR